MKKSVLVINYHEIISHESTKPFSIKDIYSVTANAFNGQVNTLIRKKVNLVSLDDVVNNRLSDEFSVAITIDDGHLSDIETVYPKLKANQIKATFFILADKQADCKYWDAVPELLNSGFSIGSHGCTHSDFKQLNAEEQLAELAMSKNELERKIGSKVNYFAFPFGSYTKESVQLAKQVGYKAVLTTEVKLNDTESHPYIIHRWSVKQNTSLKEFEGMVTNQDILRRKIATSTIKKGIKKVIGKNFSDYLNVVFDF